MTWITRSKHALKYIATMILFLSALLGMRWLWAHLYPTPEHPTAVQGVLDLRGWDFKSSPSVPLDGVWEFYPGKLLKDGDLRQPSADRPRFIHVPGDWRRDMSAGSGSSTGYGTYRLRILANTEPDQHFAFWIQDIQASAAIEINGRLAGLIGLPADRAEAYKPQRYPDTVYYTAHGEQEIELLVRVANFENPFLGGLVKNIRFGTEKAVDTERWHSVGFQFVTFIVILLHAVYTCILYFFHPREKTFVVFFLLLLTAAFTVITADNQLLPRWIPLSFAWALKIRVLSYLWIAFFILLMARIFGKIRIWTVPFRAYSAALAVYSGFLLAANSPLIYYSIEYRIFSALYLFPFAWFFYLIGRMLTRKQPEAIFLMMSATSIISNVVWGAFEKYSPTPGVYYPIDLITAIVGFSAYWFKQYFRNAAENARLTEQLRMADKLKDQFLAQTSHELRTPLHGIMNIAQTVADKERRSMDGRSLKDMELLVTVSRRMSHLLDDLLDVVRLKENRITLRKEPLSLPPLVSGVFGMLRFMAEGKSVRLSMDIDESMPPVLADEKRLVQILLNLLHNALKYTDKGTIAVSARVENGLAVMEVSDTGAGMDEETKARVFGPYEQGPLGISDGRGIGLGLSICKQMVELHGSELTVRSEPGRGSAFRFSLPLAGPSGLPSSRNLPPHEASGFEEVAASWIETDAADEVWSASQIHSSPLGDGKANILAVDDDPVNLKVLAGILSSEPYRVRTATSAREALELLESEPWDLIIADVMMPHMSGYELTQKVRERFSVAELPVLLLTARSEPADIYAGFKSGANDYVTKPVDALELKYRILSLTTMKRSVHERQRMEAAYLQAQIHPHFLFNTLNSIMALSDLDQERMRKLGDAFTSYLRISFDYLNSGKQVALTHELELVQAYLYIEKERFGDRLNIEWEVDPEIELLLPPLTIQPLVENAVRHGVLSRGKGGTVRIRIVRGEKSAGIEVRDDGKGMKPETVRQALLSAGISRGGIGLSNTNRRLTQMYGKGLSIHSAEGEGTTVSFSVPYRDARELQDKQEA
ncbi:response regulator [Cohnella sp. CFH 77786]|uniref:hybrid sensor histidine kinase/response regulator n=1 Tax=Cohnella sp. CFH 77786 TaxID=2662265 RepID=UPI001C610BCA|nr:ATP-binding protein [Cohnella sp. CFH 77786]MBW5446068.1 response regulator [Cohnella sp. CFH 77786]